MTRFLAALRRFWYPFTVQAEVRRFLAGRGEVADAPPIPKSPDEYPPKRTCQLNATPHWCADTSSDDEVIAAMEKQFRKPTFRRIR